MKCSLCNTNKVLIKKSHIIPDFLYKDIYDENHRLIKVDILKLINGKAKKSYVPTGSYDKYILCKKCDNEIIGSFETHFSKILSEKRFKYIKPTDNSKVRTYELKDFNFDKLKLFFLSILWRAAVSKLNIYRNVKLSKNQHTKIQNQILNKKTDNSLNINIIAYKFSEKSKLNRIIGMFKYTNGNYSVILKHFIVFFVFYNDDFYKISHKYSLKENELWNILEIPIEMENKVILSYLGLKTFANTL